MARWDKLTFKTRELLDDAQAYLGKHRHGAYDEQERGRIEKWSRTLDKRAHTIKAIEQEYRTGKITPEVRSSEQPTYTIFSEQLDLTGRHLGALPEWYDYKSADLVFRTFESYLQNFIQAGPHGPGGGRPSANPEPQGPGPHGPGGARPHSEGGGRPGGR
ncbi:MAG: hypothetical protein JOY62_02930 [Acidobacteriaceae bacterium]|nr:hypothetical protein [Acidobacteriaceae bacterium]MBV9778905.1 hypothetical protein [Acidobacteriaceae bacterium]